MDAQARYDEGIQQFQADRLAESAESMRRAIAAEESFEDAYEALGLILARQDKLDEAIAITRALVARNPDHLMAHVNLSVFYNKKGGMIEEAEAEQAIARVLGWRQQLGAQPAGTATAQDKGLKPLASQDGPEAKRETFLEVLQIDPEDPIANFSLGKIYLAEGQPERARDHLATVVRVQSDYSAAYLPLGEALESLGDMPGARRTYETGIRVAAARGDLKPMQMMEKKLGALQGSEAIRKE